MEQNGLTDGFLALAPLALMGDSNGPFLTSTHHSGTYLAIDGLQDMQKQ